MSSALPSYEQAAAIVAAHAAKWNRTTPSIERVELRHAAGRVLAHSVHADRDQPPFSRSTRDGYACRSAEASRHAFLSVEGSTHAGEAPAGPLSHGVAWEIMTGAPVPTGADSVMMIEHVEVVDRQVRLLPPRTVGAGENNVARGAQAQKGDELLPAGTMLAPAHIALAASCGYASIDVCARPRVAILTTGDELVPAEAEPGPGQIRNSNAPMLAALIAAAGGDPWVLPAAADTAASLDAALGKAAKADLLLISGGVSAGKFDLVEPALARLGARFHFTGVRIQSGKPLVFGELPRDGASRSSTPDVSRVLPFFGLPGNPISTAVTFQLFAAPVLAALAGRHESGPRFALAYLARDTDKHGKQGLTRFLPARCDFNPPHGRPPQVALVPWHGSGDLPAFARSNCFLVVPEDVSRLEAGAIVRILLP